MQINISSFSEKRHGVFIRVGAFNRINTVYGKLFLDVQVIFHTRKFFLPCGI